MSVKLSHLEKFLLMLEERGFKFSQETISFIYFGKHLTALSDELITAGIELTIKIQKNFDGSFYISLLELFKNNHIETRKQAIALLKSLGFLEIHS